MDTVRNLIYTVCITSIICEILIYLLPNERLHNVMRFLATIIIISSIFSVFNLIDLKNTDINKYANLQIQTENTEDFAVDVIKNEQLSILQQLIEDDLSARLKNQGVYYENISVLIFKSNEDINKILCELYLSSDVKENFEMNKSKIFDGFELDIKTYYI